MPKLDLLLFADYSQIEYRLFAWYMAEQVGDRQAVEAYKSGKDFHEETAKRMLEATGKTYSTPLTDAERQVGKTGNFAAIYSGGTPTIQRQLGCSQSVARELADAFHGQYPLLGRWAWRGRGFSDPDPHTLNGQIVSRLRERGYISTLWGRHLHPLEDRKALNALVQGGAADLMKASMVRLARAMVGMESHMVLSVHDEIGFDVREGELPALLELVPEAMCDEPVLTAVIPLAVDMKMSYDNWADAKEVECPTTLTVS